MPEPHAGLCETCANSKQIHSDRGSIFYQCRLSFTDPAFPNYPRLPVLTCGGYQPLTSPPAK
jgi:hypothetical protein